MRRYAEYTGIRYRATMMMMQINCIMLAGLGKDSLSPTSCMMNVVGPLGYKVGHF